MGRITRVNSLASIRLSGHGGGHGLSSTDVASRCTTGALGRNMKVAMLAF
jgi:hypothetical protein